MRSLPPHHHTLQQVVDLTSFSRAASSTANFRRSGSHARLFYYRSLPSTQTLLRNNVDKFFRAGDIIVTDEQTAGYGRKGDKWLSFKGTALTFSFLWRVPLHPTTVFYTQLVALALAEALDDVKNGEKNGVFSGYRQALKKNLAQQCGSPTLKWPNDILWGGKKVAGIIIHQLPVTTLPPARKEEYSGGNVKSAQLNLQEQQKSERFSEKEANLVIGVGLNALETAQQLKAYNTLRKKSLSPKNSAYTDVEATSFFYQTGKFISRDKLLLLFLERFLSWDAIIRCGDKASLLTAWRQRSHFLGQIITLQEPLSSAYERNANAKQHYKQAKWRVIALNAKGEVTLEPVRIDPSTGKDMLKAKISAVSAQRITRNLMELAVL